MESHIFLLAKISYMLGNIIFMSKVEGVALIYPIIPFFFLLIITILLVFLTVTVNITGLSTIIPFIFAACAIGALDGSMFSAFLFHAVTTTDLPSSMRLHFQERELVVNLLMISQSMGKFFGLVFSHMFFAYNDPNLLFKNP